MRLSEASIHLGGVVTMNGRGDLAMNSEFREYIYPRPKIPFTFTIHKITRGGHVYIQCNENKKYHAVNAKNIDLIELKENYDN